MNLGSTCVDRPISIPASGTHTSSATMKDWPDKPLYQTAAYMSNKEHTKQMIVTLWSDHPSDEFLYAAAVMMSILVNH